MKQLISVISLIILLSTSNAQALTAITLGVSGENRTLMSQQWLSTYSKIIITATLEDLTDVVTIYRVKDGATGKDVVVGFLTNENATISTDENGNNGDFTTAKGDFVVFDKELVRLTETESELYPFSIVLENGKLIRLTEDGKTDINHKCPKVKVGRRLLKFFSDVNRMENREFFSASFHYYNK